MWAGVALEGHRGSRAGMMRKPWGHSCGSGAGGVCGCVHLGTKRAAGGGRSGLGVWAADAASAMGAWREGLAQTRGGRSRDAGRRAGGWTWGGGLGEEGRRVPAQAGAAPQMWAGRQGRQGTAERRAGPAWERGEGYDACPGAGGAEGLTGRWSLWEGQGLSVLGRRASRRVPRACQWRRPRPGLGSACLPPLFPRSAPRRARGYARFLAAAPHPSTGQFLVRLGPCAGADACKAPDIRGGADAVAA